jgi:hypothetical protein
LNHQVVHHHRFCCKLLKEVLTTIRFLKIFHITRGVLFDRYFLCLYDMSFEKVDIFLTFHRDAGHAIKQLSLKMQ